MLAYISSTTVFALKSRYFRLFACFSPTCMHNLLYMYVYYSRICTVLYATYCGRTGDHWPTLLCHYLLCRSSDWEQCYENEAAEDDIKEQEQKVRMTSW